MTRANVALAYTRDVGRGIVRLEPEDLGVEWGGVVLLSGGTKTAAKYAPLYPSDRGKGIVRMDGLVRLNCSSSVGDEVEVTRAAPESAESIVLTPIGSRADLAEHFIEEAREEPVSGWYANEALLGRPVMSGDVVSLPYMKESLAFLLLGHEPESEVAMVTPKTRVEIVPRLVA